MCGIAGVVGEVGPAQRLLVRAMTAALRHRGPDDEGYHDGPGVSVGTRRLAIVDVARGRQPVASEDGRVVAVVNGEIYNHAELRGRLTRSGHRLASGSDAEVVPHLYEESGAALVDALRGMFALAVWDAAEQRLVLARDRVGKKPLFYFIEGGGSPADGGSRSVDGSGARLWFASELKALLALPHVSREPDPVAIDHYLAYQYVPHPWSIIRDVNKLPPAHVLTWQAGRARVRRYWDLHFADGSAAREPGHSAGDGASDADPTSAEAAALGERLREELLNATGIRMESERPMGAFLSGGLDSSAVVAAMARQASGTVTTYSIGFEEEVFNELPHARRVAEVYGTDHRELVVRPDMTDVLPRIARMFDEPFADSSAVPSHYVAQLAGESAVVVLTGDGGDEAFGGYRRYLLPDRFLGELRLPQPVARAGAVGAALVQRLPVRSRVLHKAGRAAGRMSATTASARYGRAMSYFLPEERRSMWRREYRAALDPEPLELVEQSWRRRPRTHQTHRMMGSDIDLYLPGDLLAKVDITTMAASVEARSPLLDHRLLEWAATVPHHWKVADGRGKRLFKLAMEPWLPADIIHRPKMGFGIPREEWLRGPLRPMVHDILLDRDSRVARYLRPAAIARLVRASDRPGSNVDQRVWALLMLELWHREVAEAPRADAAVRSTVRVAASGTGGATG